MARLVASRRVSLAIAERFDRRHYHDGVAPSRVSQAPMIKTSTPHSGKLRARLRLFVARFGRRTLVVVGALSVWTAVVVTGFGSESDSDNLVGIPALQATVTVIVLAGVVAGLGVLIAFLMSSERGDRRDHPQRMWFLSGFVLVLLVVVLLRELDWGETTPRDVAPEAVASESSSDPITTSVGLGDVAGPLIVLISIAAVIGWARYGRISSALRARGEEEPKPADLGAVISSAHRQLVIGNDPRSAILAAYATVEASFELRGEGRRAAETAEEHVRRVLSASDAIVDPEPLLRLAGLYEVARFSRHVITRHDQRLAASNLEQMKRQLLVESTS